MDPARTLRTVFLLLAATHVVGMQVGASVTGWTGSAALAVLLLAVLLPGPPGDARRWPRHALRVALAALTVTALLLDARFGGTGWPAMLGLGAGPGGWGPVEAALLAVAGGAAAVAALGVVGLPSGWRLRLLPALGVLPALGLLAVVSLPVWYPGLDVVTEMSPAYVVAATAPLQAAFALLGLAAGALAAARRWVGAAGLMVVGALLLPVLSGVLDDPRLERPRPALTQGTGILASVVPSSGVFIDGRYIGAIAVDHYEPDLSGLLERSAHRPPAILPPPEPPLVPDDPPSTPTDFWSVESVWPTPAWFSLALLLALTAFIAAIAAPGTDAENLPDAGLAGG